MSNTFTRWDVRRVLTEELQAAQETNDETLFKRVVGDLYTNELYGMEDSPFRDIWEKHFAWVPEYIAERKEEDE